MLYLPNALTKRDMQMLCNRHFIEIVHGNTSFAKDVIVRYVAEEGKFGYAPFGTFFFNYDRMYLLRSMAEPDENSKLDIFEEYFTNHFDDDNLAWNDCMPVTFAGIRTVNKDVNGEWIYTGDIVENVDDDFIWGGVGAAPGTYPKEWGPVYAIMGDNHCQHLRDAGRLLRIGTVLYQLESANEPIDIEVRCIRLHAQGSQQKEEILKKAIYTPSFDMEEWKYAAKVILGIEPTWNK